MSLFLNTLAAVSVLGSSVDPYSNDQSSDQSKDEIVVTIRHPRSASLSLSGIRENVDRQTLQNPGMYAASDLSRVTTGLTHRSIFGSSSPQFFIRGIGSNDVNPSTNSGISVYLNDVFISSPLGQNLSIFDVDEANIFKGPQGTLFGRNATGGAIVLRTVRPAEVSGHNITAGTGSFGLTSLEAAWDIGRTGAVRTRIAAFSRRSSGYTRDTVTGNHLNGIDTAGIRATVSVDSKGPWRAEIIADYSVDRSGMTAHEGLGLLEPEGLSANPQIVAPCTEARVLSKVCVNVLGYSYSTDPYAESFDRDDREHLDVGGVSLNLIRSGVIDFHSITSYRTAVREVREDTDASPLSIVALDFDNESSAMTQEFLLHGSASKIDWHVGVFFLNEKLKTQNRFDTLRTLREIGVDFIDDQTFFAYGPFRLQQTYVQETSSTAVFGEVDWQLSSALRVTAGLRLTHEQTDFETETKFDELTKNPLLSPRRSASKSEEAASWKLLARYKFAPGRSVYGSLSRGFKSGGFNGGALFASDSIGPVEPEFVTALELGAQWRVNDAVNVDAAVFHYDYTDLQDFTFRPAPPPTRQVLDSADAKMVGADIRVEGSLPLGFSAALSLSLLDAKFVDFVDANQIDRTGNRLTAAPELTALAHLNWRRQVTPNWDAVSSISFRHRSEIFFDNTNNSLLRSDDATLTDLTLELEHTPGEIAVSIAIRNLTNEAVIADALLIAEYGFIQRTYAEPRTVYVQIRKQF